MMITDAFLKEIPKTDVHLHLDGSLRLTTLIELAQKNNIALPFYDEENLRNAVFPDHYEDLPSYLRGFRYTCAVMQKAEDLTRISYELAQDCIAEGVRYIEVRFAPQLHMTDLSFDEVLQAVNAGLSRAKEEFWQSDSVVHCVCLTKIHPAGMALFSKTFLVIIQRKFMLLHPMNWLEMQFVVATNYKYPLSDWIWPVVNMVIVPRIIQKLFCTVITIL